MASVPLVGTTKKKRFGVFKVAVGSTHMVRQKNGKDAQFTAAERTRFPEAKTVVRCKSKECRGREWPDEKSMLADHPATSVMVKQEEEHAYYWWSTDPQPEKAAEVATTLSKDTPKDERERALAKIPIIGILTDE